MISKGSSDQPAVYLSFDDGPDPEFTPRILDLLDFFQVRATFFVLGRACVRFPDLLKRIHGAGHALGNHTFHHFHPWLIGRQTARCEVRSTYCTIADILGEAPRLFRPPYGRRRKVMLEEAKALGMETVFWTRSARDWGSMTNTDAIGRRLSKIEAGDIVLCHDAPLVKNHPEMTLEVLPAFINECRGQQLRFARLDELIPSSDEAGPQRSHSIAQPL